MELNIETVGKYLNTTVTLASGSSIYYKDQTTSIKKKKNANSMLPENFLIIKARFLVRLLKLTKNPKAATVSFQCNPLNLKNH